MSNFISRCIVRIKKILLKPRMPVTRQIELVSLGTDYGGWTFFGYPGLKRTTIVSCGAGEDISFEVKFADTYAARVIVVDPTPRAIAHVNEVIARAGMGPAISLGSGGCQPVEAYDMQNVSSDQLVLVPKALWNENTVLKFFLPANKEHVSHSIVNFQNKYSETSEHIEVATTTLPDLLGQFNLTEVEIVKLDIEGAEIEVIEHMLGAGVLPRQLLIEYDEMNVPSRKGKRRIENSYNLLIRSGYDLVYFDGASNFCFVLKSFLAQLQAGSVPDSATV